MANQGQTNPPVVDRFDDFLVTQLSSTPRSIAYSYDGLQRLLSATEGCTDGACPVPNIYSYTYDNAGNRLTSTANGATTTRTYNAANQVTGWTYDAVGNLTSDGTTTSTYDALSRVTGRTGITFAYNGDGTLVSQVLSAVTTRYTQDLASPLSQILGDGTNTYVYGLDRLYGTTGTKTWYTADALGSVRATLSDTGVVGGAAFYDPYGQVQSGSIGSFGFTGELQQGSNVYLRARWFNASAGSFVSRDPFEGMAEVPASLQYYAYGYSNPISNRDPSGRCIEWLWNDPSCQFIGEDRVRRGDLEWEEGLPWAGAGLDVLPIIGDAKGLVEVFTGCDIVTGEDLGNWRWMGLIFFSEGRHLRNLDEVELLYDVTRFTDDIPARSVVRHASGHSPELQQAIARALKPGEYVAFRSRAHGAERFDFGVEALPNKPVGHENIVPPDGHYPDGMRLVYNKETGKIFGFAVSDMDAAWAVKGGRMLTNGEFTRGMLRRINTAYGAGVVQHGPHVNGVTQRLGAKADPYLKETVYVYGPNGLVDEGPMLDMLLKYSPTSSSAVEWLRTLVP